MGIPAGNDTASGRTAAARGKVSVIKTHAIGSQRINMWGLDHGVAVTSEIILRYIIGNKEDNIGSL